MWTNDGIDTNVAIIVRLATSDEPFLSDICALLQLVQPHPVCDFGVGPGIELVPYQGEPHRRGCSGMDPRDPCAVLSLFLCILSQLLWKRGMQMISPIHTV